ncbi:MFS transporter, partial [candidate division KSB1 bacterium]
MNRSSPRPPLFSWALYDFANSAFATTIVGVIFNRYYAQTIAGGADGAAINFGLFSLHLPGASWWTFCVSLSMAVVALLAPIMGAIADYSGSKKKFLFIFFVLGVAGTTLMATIGPGELVWASTLLILANVGFACANVFYNAFLTDISTPSNIGRVSGYGWALGYLGGGLLLLINLIMLQKPELLGFSAGTFTIHHCFLSVALWWTIFSMPLFLRVKDRPVDSQRLNLTGYIRTGFGRLRRTFRQIKKYRELFKFLGAYFLYNDGIQTVLIITAIFGAEVVGMGLERMIVYFLMIQFVALGGSL